MSDGSIPPIPPRSTQRGRLKVGRGSVRLRGLPSAVRLREERDRLARELDRQALVLHINQLLLDHLDPEELFVAISTALWEQTRHHYMLLTALEEDKAMERLRFLDVPTERGRFRIGSGPVPDILVPASAAYASRKAQVLSTEQVAAIDPPSLSSLLTREGIRSICQVPLFSRGKALGILALGSRSEAGFTADMLRLLEQVAGQFAVALDNALAFQGIRSSRDQLAEEKLYLEEEVRRDFSTQEIIGESRAIQRVLDQVGTVAGADATVLLLGETGTGKELLARAIHEGSRRQARTFVKLNCSAIPMGLVESELFGHERGAFTGAIARKIGRFELAHRGTLFLDEVGDLPLDLQPKLLRAIQEREFERLGSTQTQRVDVRLIAATHRDLARMVETGEYRMDLFYRLNVFPIRVPPLRERKEDIPQLVRYFTQKHAKAMDKRIDRIPGDTMQALVNWPWPGNIRELQNLVERSVILSPGNELRVPLAELSQPREALSTAPALTLEDVERQGILAALEACGWVVGGPDGAAARLGLKRTTLNFKMKKLGLDRGK
jgi:formate hydrogenlyase transcriptional activator